jgi:mannose-6-phosphate isomerase-like protein (cupin superfamily)
LEYTSLIKPPKSRHLKSGRVILKPNEEVGEHITDKREEIIIVLRGKATILLEGETIEVLESQTHYIKEEKRHNIRNDQDVLLEYIYMW